MLGKLKKKLTNFIDSRVHKILSSKQPTEDKKEYVDVSMAEAELRKQQNELLENLKFSFQRDFSSLSYTKDGKQVAMDSIGDCMKNNTMVGMTGSPKDIVFSFFAKFGYIGWQICSVLAQHWLISNACSISNKDCLRNGWNNIFIDKKDNEESEEEKEKNQDILNKLYEVENQEFNLNDKLLKWSYFVNVYGTAYLLPKIDGIDYEKPFNIDGVKKGSFKGLAVIEPYWMIPNFDLSNVTDPTDIDFFEPDSYLTNKGKIHKSHLIIGRRKFVSDILKPTYYYGGISLAQEIYERVYASERCANEAPLLLLTKRLNYYKVKIKELFTNPHKYKELAELLTEMRDNQGVLFADHDDDFGQIDTSLSDLDQVIMEQYKLVSAIARIPADKLFETNPTGGLSASGDYNIKNYNQDLNTLQNDRFKPAIDRINEIVMRSYFDKKDRVGIVFNPTDNPTEKEIAELNKQKADMDTVYIQNGIITPEEARQRLVNDKLSGYSFLKGVEMEEPTPEEQQEIEQMMNGMKDNDKDEDNKEGKDEDDIEWITVNGSHIPIKEGENKADVVKNFINKKGKNGNTNISGNSKIGENKANTAVIKGKNLITSSNMPSFATKKFDTVMKEYSGKSFIENVKYIGNKDSQDLRDYFYNYQKNLLVSNNNDMSDKEMDKICNDYVKEKIKKIEKEFKSDKGLIAYYDEEDEMLFVGRYYTEQESKKEGKYKNGRCVDFVGGYCVEPTIHHEIAHCIDKKYKIKKDKRIIELWKKTSIMDKKKQLSDYSTDSIEEFIAEGWAEYKWAKKPTELGTKIGKIIDEYIKNEK